jgi:hypothetical protein
MLDVNTLNAQALKGLSPSAITELAASLLAQLAAKDDEIARRDREIRFKDAKLERLTLQLAQFKAWKFGARTELPGLELCELQRQAFELGVLEPDLAIAAGNLVVLGSQLREQRRGQLGDGARAQPFEGLRVERVHIEHADIVGSPAARGHGASANCPARGLPRRTRGSAFSSHAADALHVLQALPRQTEHEGVELRARELRQRGALTRPEEATLVQAPRCAPHAESVVHEQLHARAARVGKEVPVVRLRAAKDLHHARQQPLGTGAHVHGLGREPHRVDADHRSSSRIQPAIAGAADVGQATLSVSAPRRSSTWIRSPVGASDWIGTGTNDGVATGAATGAGR